MKDIQERERRKNNFESERMNIAQKTYFYIIEEIIYLGHR
jgi:hypothetical protein